jgi:hypothetical protein
MHDLTRLNRRQSNGKGGVRDKKSPAANCRASQKD